MLRFCSLLLLAGLTGCATDPLTDDDVATVEQAATAAFTRQHVRGDIWHYEATIPVGDGPNAAIRIHRIVRESAPWRPRPTPHAAMSAHMPRPRVKPGSRPVTAVGLNANMPAEEQSTCPRLFGHARA